jgi:hypothetical protein
MRLRYYTVGRQVVVSSRHDDMTTKMATCLKINRQGLQRHISALCDIAIDKVETLQNERMLSIGWENKLNVSEWDLLPRYMYFGWRYWKHFKYFWLRTLKISWFYRIRHIFYHIRSFKVYLYLVLCSVNIILFPYFYFGEVLFILQYCINTLYISLSVLKLLYVSF